MVEITSIKQNYSLCLSTVQEFAPFIYLHSEEQFWLSDVNSFLPNMEMHTPKGPYNVKLDRATLVRETQSLDASLNTNDGVHLQSIEEIQFEGIGNFLIVPPSWMKGAKPTSDSQLHCYTVITESPDLLSVQITYWWFFN